MKIAVLSDIHGNHYALEEVLVKAKKLQVEYLFVLGDCVGYYYHSAKVLDLLFSWKNVMIQGNHERFIKQILNHELDIKDITAKYGHGLQFGMDELGDERLDLLANLPEKQSIDLDNINFLLCHGSPWNADEYVYPDAANDSIHKFDEFNTDFIFLGHTHYPCVFYNRKFIINPGAVGQSRVVGGIANWGIIDTSNRSYSPQATPYNTDQLIKETFLYDPQMPYLSNVLQRK